MRLPRNILAFLLALPLVLLLILPLLLIAGIFRRPAFIYSSARLVIRAALRVLGVRATVRGLDAVDPSVPAVLVCNHLSNLDGPLLVSILPLDPRVLIKIEARKIPLVGWIMKLADFVFVDRSNPSRRQEALAEAIAKIKEKRYSFLVFPEGTRSRDGMTGEFKKGGFVMAQRAGVPVLPVKISGTHRLWPPGRKTCAAGLVEIEFFPLLDLGGVPENEMTGFVWDVRRRIYVDEKNENH